MTMATSASEISAQLRSMGPDVTKRRHVVLLNQIGGTAEAAARRYPTAAIVVVLISKKMLERESRLPWHKTDLTTEERQKWLAVRQAAKTVLLSIELEDVHRHAFFTRLTEQVPQDCFIMAATEMGSPSPNFIIRRVARAFKNDTRPRPDCMGFETALRELHDQNSRVAIRFLTRSCACCDECIKEFKEVKKCSRCMFAYYCSTDCQRTDWQRHKDMCAMFRN